MARRPAPQLPLRAASSALCLAVASVLLLGSLLATFLGHPSAGAVGQLATMALQIVAFAVPALLVCRAAGVQARTALGLQRPDMRSVVGAVLIGSSFWLVNATFIAPLGLELFGRTDELEEMSRHFASAPLLLTIATTAVTPAICEELLFRGAFARSLAARTGPLGAVLASAAVFAAIHFPLARMVPAFATGLVLAHVALATRSTVAAILVHLINNGVAIGLSRLASSGEDGQIATPMWLAMAAALTTIAGLAVVTRPTPGK